MIVGAADHEDEYSRGLIQQQSERIVFTGRQAPATVAALYENASLFVLPSYHEGLPLVALEAMSHGLPVLLSDIEANKDVDLQPANYFRTGDIDHLAEKLRSICSIPVSNPALLQRFDWDPISCETMHLYFDLMAQQSAVTLRC